MTNNYYQKQITKRYQNIKKGEKRPEKDINILLQKKKV